jgi:hypothetical protein
MSEDSFRLVHSRSFVGAPDDFAVALLLSVVGLVLEFAIVAAGLLLA